jgi:hypothetical protein
VKKYIIGYLQNGKVREIAVYDNKKDFERNIKNSNEIGEPIKTKIIENKKEVTQEIERELSK